MVDGRANVATLSVNDAIECWFADDSSRGSAGITPRFVLVTGTPASGKTRLRHEKYATGFVTVDAGDIFRQIPNSEKLDFPGELELFIDAVGEHVARRAIVERRHIVTEVFDADPAKLTGLIYGMKALGYHTELVGVRTGLEQSLEWNVSRGLSNISSYHTDRFNVRWLCEAAEAQAALDEGS